MEMTLSYIARNMRSKTDMHRNMMKHAHKIAEGLKWLCQFGDASEGKTAERVPYYLYTRCTKSLQPTALTPKFAFFTFSTSRTRAFRSREFHAESAADGHE